MGTRIYIGKLSHHARERDVDRFFRSYGRIRDIQLKNGYGFIEFEDHRDADDAVYELNGKDLCGDRIYLEIARGARGRGEGGYRGGGRGGDSGYRRSTVPSWLTKYGPPTRTDNRIVVENLSSRVSWQDLKDYMRQAGEVTYADAHKKHKNEGVVEFASHSDMKIAIDKLDGTEINGRKIKMIYDGPKRRSRSRSRSRSRHSRSRSRSRSRSHSRSRGKSRSRSGSRNGKRDSRSKSPARKSRSRSLSDSRSKSRSPVKAGSAAKNDD